MDAEPTLSEIPDHWWYLGLTCGMFADLLSQHLLGLYISVEIEGKIQETTYSGFLFQNEGQLLWLTAGHVIDNIRRVEKSSEAKIKQMQWLDGGEISGAEAITVHHRPLKSFSAIDLGLDFGAIVITGLDAAHILGNGRSMPLTEVGWKNLNLAQPEGFYLVGYPNEGENPRGVTLLCLPVRRIADPHKQFWNDPEAFYGEIIPFAGEDTPRYQPRSVKGMSGGPIFSIERVIVDSGNPRIKYYLFGILRSEIADERLIRAEPIQRIAELIKDNLASNPS